MKRIFACLLALMLCCACACAEAGLTAFSTVDVDGNAVTQDVFADYDLTVVNVWATWCGYCVEEMPELAKLKDMLPENVNLITICTDADVEGDLTREILSASSAGFQTLLPSQEMEDQLLGAVYAFPTTCFLNSKGEVVAESLVGVPSRENAADAYYAIIQEVLGAMEK